MKNIKTILVMLIFFTFSLLKADIIDPAPVASVYDPVANVTNPMLDQFKIPKEFRTGINSSTVGLGLDLAGISIGLIPSGITQSIAIFPGLIGSIIGTAGSINIIGGFFNK